MFERWHFNYTKLQIPTGTWDVPKWLLSLQAVCPKNSPLPAKLLRIDILHMSQKIKKCCIYIHNV
jgi:hypothetical protein